MKRSKFSLSNYKLLTCNMGTLIPCNLMEVLPGDTVQAATSLLLRVTPLVAPVMHPVRIRIHHWFVPHRLIWEDWEDFITGGPDGMDASAFPVLDPSSAPDGPADYYGIPQGYPGPVSALPFRGYNMIWNEFYRDQDLELERVLSESSGTDVDTDITTARVCWEKDYFTSARPWTQKGPDVSLPIGAVAPVRRVALGSAPQFYQENNSGGGVTPDQTLKGFEGGSLPVGAGGADASYMYMVDGPNSPAAAQPLRWGAATGLEADLASASAVNINELRRAFALQRYEEARARYGSRYTEYLRYLGVKSSDARLQRPEYLGGGKQTIQFSEVLQTGPDPDATSGEGVANLKGHGIAAMRSNRFRRFFEEHGYVHSFISVLPRTIYQQGVPRTFNRRFKEDFFQRELQHIGQQEVLTKELYAASATGDAVWGYQDRYDEYRRSESSVHGEFRTILDYWHFGRQFASEPVLNQSFVQADPTDRPFAEKTQNSLWIMCNNSIQARRQVAASGKSFIF
ncbi:major capsid protein [robinz microvirus RP_133]|nr:major capsid protein [robinz microvirus RP_133]